VLTDFGADHAFGAAATKVREHYGVTVAVERVRTVTLHHAHVLAAQVPQPVRTLPAHGPAQIVAEADGTMVPIVDTSAAPRAPTGASIGGRAIRKRAWSPRRPTARSPPTSAPPCTT
jgi:hypothetical protein